MNEKNVRTRIINKHDIEANWLKASGFIPKQGEIIVYDIEVDQNGNVLELPEGRVEPYRYERIKIGDGITEVNTLNFYYNTDLTDIFSNALKGSAQGNPIALNDVSPIAHDIKYKLESKNLFNAYAVNGLVYNNQDVSLKGYQENGILYATMGTYGGVCYWKGFVFDLEPNIYTISCEAYTDLTDTNQISSVLVDIETNTRVTPITERYQAIEAGKTTKFTWVFNINEKKSYALSLQGGGNANNFANLDVRFSKVQIEHGAVATLYTPYIDTLEGIEVKAQGKNLCDNVFEAGTINATNGNLEVNETIVRMVNYIPINPNTVYTIKKVNFTNNRVFFRFYDKDKKYLSYIGTMSEQIRTFATAENEYYLRICVGDMIEYPINPLIQVELGNASTEYEPYKESVIYTTNADGVINISSIAPNMTIAAIVDGAIIEVEYNKDINSINTQFPNIYDGEGKNSLIEGENTQALGDYSHSSGINTVAEGKASHTEGSDTKAQGDFSHVEGKITTAFGEATHAEGLGFGILNEFPGLATLNITIINVDKKLGTITIPALQELLGALSQIQGEFFVIKINEDQYFGVLRAIVNADYSVTFTLAVDPTYDDISGLLNQKITNLYMGIAYGDYSHIEGKNGVAYGMASHTEGMFNLSFGEASHAEGLKTAAAGLRAHTEGFKTIAYGNNSHAEGNTTVAEGENSHAEGVNSKSIGDYSHAEGDQTQAIGNTSHTEGYKTIATGLAAHSEGWDNKVYSVYAHAEGIYNEIGIEDGDPNDVGKGRGSHIEGRQNKIFADGCHVEGILNEASHNYSHVGGEGNRTSASYQYVIGTYNNDNANAKFIIGNGVADQRGNLFEIGQDASGAFLTVGSTKVYENQLKKLLALLDQDYYII